MMKKPIVGSRFRHFSCQYFSTVSLGDFWRCLYKQDFAIRQYCHRVSLLLEDRYFLSLPRFLDCLSADCPN